jgi:hypothetical protein
MSRKSQEGTDMCHGKGNNVVYKSRKWKHHMCMSRKWQQLTCMLHGNYEYNNVRVYATEMMDSFGVGTFSRSPQDCYNHMVEVCLKFRRCYLRKCNSRRIQMCSNVYSTAALSSVNTAGNDLRMYPALSQETPANLYLRRDVTSLCLASLDSSSSPSTFYIVFVL